MNKKEISIIRYFKEFLDKIWIVILLTVVCGALLFVYSSFLATPMYTSQAKMYVNNKASDGSGGTGTVTNSEIQARMALVKTYASIIKSNNIMNKVCGKIDAYKNQPGYEFLQDSNYTAKSLINAVSVTPDNDTEVFFITMKADDPQKAQFIVEAITEYLPDVISNTMEASSAKLIDEADLNLNPTSPNIATNTIIGAFIGFAIAALIIFLILMTDTVVRSESDLTEEFEDVIVLGAIPLMHIDPDKVQPADHKTAQ